MSLLVPQIFKFSDDEIIKFGSTWDVEAPTYPCSFSSAYFGKFNSQLFLLFVSEVFGVQGVPMLYIITETGLITWQARFAACKQDDLDSFLDEALRELSTNQDHFGLGRMSLGSYADSQAFALRRGN